MKRSFIVVVLLLAACAPRQAVARDIDGKWGLSAPLFETVPGEFSLIRGTQGGAWILDADLNFLRQRAEEQDPTVNPDFETRVDRSDWEIGPRWRRYTRGDSDLSPYLDVFLHGVYTRTSSTTLARTVPANSNSSTMRTLGANLGAGVGVELFTKWGMSAALSTRVLGVTWLRTRQTAGGPALTDIDVEGSIVSIDFTFRPRIYIRGYW